MSENKPVFTLKFLHPKFWLLWVAIFLYFMISLLPVFILDFIGERLGDVFSKTNKKRFGYVKTNLSLCFPDKTEHEIEKMCVEHFRSLMRSMMHYGKLWWAPKFYLNNFLDRKGFQLLEKLKQNNKNIIILTCHTVGLEFVGTALSLLYPCSGPYKPMKNPVMDWIITKGRTRFGIKVFTRDDGLRPLIKNTRKGSITIYLADEDLGAQQSLFVPFFGVEKATIPVLGRLTKACDAVVVPCYSYYEKKKRKYIVMLLPALTEFPVGDDIKDSLKMNQTIEEMINLCPEQYFWTLRIFKTRPDVTEYIYDRVVK